MFIIYFNKLLNFWIFLCEGYVFGFVFMLMILIIFLIVSVDYFMYKIDFGLKGFCFYFSVKGMKISNNVEKNIDLKMLIYYGKIVLEKGIYVIFNDDFRLNYKIDLC